jgi:hypothetical protein
VTAEKERFARIALSFVGEPGDLVLGALLRACGPAEAFAVICDGCPPEPVTTGHGGVAGLGRVIGRWAARLGAVPAESRLADWKRSGYRVVCPGDPERPTQLDVLGDARPPAGAVVARQCGPALRVPALGLGRRGAGGDRLWPARGYRNGSSAG